ncbi:replicative DNA helicase, partial [Candidatus Parcubacteria bacterium]|nr:replicative DNA helicase [Candidatus Parcubacteria bacterium]
MNNNDNTKKFGIEKMPPQNVDAEQTLLCSLLIDKDVILKVVDIVNEHDFYKNSHRYIFEAMKDLYAKNEPIDILTLTNKLKEREQLEKIGGRTYLAHLSNVSATSAHAENYAEIIQKKATLRRLIKAAKRITELGYDENEEVDKLLDEAEQNLFKVSQAYSKTQFISIDNLLSDAFERIDDLHKNGSKKSGLTSGYPDLDRLLTGFQKSDLIIIAARPSVGKTTFALDIARKVAITNKSSIALFSLEMSKEQLVDRLLCAESNVSLWKMRSGKLSDKENDNDFEKIGLGMGKLSEAPIFIDDSPGCSIMDVRSKARRLQVEKGLDMIIIDYLQLMEGRGNKNDNRVQEIAEISRGLKGIARELNIPVIALS